MTGGVSTHGKSKLRVLGGGYADDKKCYYRGVVIGDKKCNYLGGGYALTGGITMVGQTNAPASRCFFNGKPLKKCSGLTYAQTAPLACLSSTTSVVSTGRAGTVSPTDPCYLRGKLL